VASLETAYYSGAAPIVVDGDIADWLPVPANRVQFQDSNGPSGTHASEPNWGTPCGFGVGQREDPTVPEVWNWWANVQGSISLMRTNQAIGQGLWAQAVKNYTTYVVLNATSPNFVPPPCDQNVAPTNFYYSYYAAISTPLLTAMPTVADLRPFSDASAMKYNAYNNGPYLTWNVSKRTWNYTPNTPDGNNYPFLFLTVTPNPFQR
jgi:hypothetical protein